MIEKLSKTELANYISKIKSKPTKEKQSRRGGNITKATDRSLALLDDCASYYDGMANLRKSRDRNLRYRNGDQWSDLVPDPENGNRLVKEEEVISRGGKIPLKYNFIGQYVRNLTGQMLSSPSQSVVYARGRENDTISSMLTNALQASHTLNNISKLDIAILEELLLSGIGCVKVRYDYMSSKNRYDASLSLVNMNRLFFNADIEDPRMDDIRDIGEIHDYTFQELIHNFATTDQDSKQLAKIYGYGAKGYKDDNRVTTQRYINDKSNISSSFYSCSDPDKCRVIEVWRRRGRWVNSIHDWADGTEEITNLSQTAINQINRDRIALADPEIEPENIPLIDFERIYEYFWDVTFLAPTGEVLRNFESPYRHNSHPYILATMPMVDGQIRSSITDLIDIQRYINRLVVMIDFILGTSAKGVLMIPENSIPDGYTVEDFADEYVKTNGVIVYRPTAQNVAPYQITSNSSAVGAQTMLSLQMDLMRQISGISGAMQGQQPPSGTPSSLYAQQVANGLTNHKVTFEALRQYRSLRDEKLLNVITQFYQESRYIYIGSDKLSVSLYDPQLVKDMVDFSIVVTQSHDTPVYRQAFDDIMLTLLNRGHISSEIFLRNCSLPFADKLLLDMEREKLAQLEALTALETQPQEKVAS